ncbi:MAG: hypothetical protein J5821_00195 [Alphaproteobacteria bacterium]|nr:hypothetical protein [Alphaproteobacteria bacterium]
MRLIILNMMILGMAASLIGKDVFAKDFVKTEDILSENPVYEKSQNNIRKNKKLDNNYDGKGILKGKQVRERTEEHANVSTPSKPKIPPAPPRPSVEGVDSGSKVPPPPPPPFAMNGSVPPPPPPFSMGGNTLLPAKEVDVDIIMKDLRGELDEFLDDNSIKTTANIVNLYLAGNKEKISEGVSTAEAAMTRLDGRLNKDLEEMRKMADTEPSSDDSKESEKTIVASSIIKEYIEIFEALQVPLKKLTAKEYRAENPDKRKTFREVSREINKIAHEYFQKVMTSGEKLKKVPSLTAVKDAEIVLERAVVLSDSFSNLVDLSVESRNEAFSERSTRDAIQIINLKRFISNKLKEIDSAVSEMPMEEKVTEKEYSGQEYLEKTLQYIDKVWKGNSQLQNLKEFISDKIKEIDLASLKKLVKLPTGDETSEKKQSESGVSKNFVKLPTGDEISEKEYLEKAFRYIDETCKGNDQLQKLLDMRDVLNNKYTTIVSNDQTDNKKNPLMIIRNLDDRIAKIGNLLEQASKESKNDKYSQFGRMFTEGDTGYGGALIASVNKWIDFEDFAEFSADKVRKSFQGKNLSGNIIAEYIRLLTADMNLCKSFAKNVISTMSRRKNFKASSIVTTRKRTEIKKEDQKILVEITNGQAKLGTSSDPQKDRNLIPFSMLKKNCEEYVKEIISAEKEVREIPEVLKKIKKSFSREITDKELAAYISSILKNYFLFEDFPPQDDQVRFNVVNTKKGLLSAEDVPNVVFALAQNCDLAVKQPALPLFPTSKDTDNVWVLKMAMDLCDTTSHITKMIYDINDKVFAGKDRIRATKVEELIEKLQKLENSIKDAVSRVAKGLPTAISNAKKEVSAEKEQIGKTKLNEITEELQNLSESAKDVTVPYAENKQIDKDKLCAIISNLQKINETIASGGTE